MNTENKNNFISDDKYIKQFFNVNNNCSDTNSLNLDSLDCDMKSQLVFIAKEFLEIENDLAPYVNDVVYMVSKAGGLNDDKDLIGGLNPNICYKDFSNESKSELLKQFYESENLKCFFDLFYEINENKEIGDKRGIEDFYGLLCLLAMFRHTAAHNDYNKRINIFNIKIEDNKSLVDIVEELYNHTFPHISSHSLFTKAIGVFCFFLSDIEDAQELLEKIAYHISNISKTIEYETDDDVIDLRDKLKCEYRLCDFGRVESELYVLADIFSGYINQPKFKQSDIFDDDISQMFVDTESISFTNYSQVDYNILVRRMISERLREKYDFINSPKFRYIIRYCDAKTARKIMENKSAVEKIFKDIEDYNSREKTSFIERNFSKLDLDIDEYNYKEKIDEIVEIVGDKRFIDKYLEIAYTFISKIVKANSIYFNANHRLETDTMIDLANDKDYSPDKWAHMVKKVYKNCSIPYEIKDYFELDHQSNISIGKAVTKDTFRKYRNDVEHLTIIKHLYEYIEGYDFNIEPLYYDFYNHMIQKNLNKTLEGKIICEYDRENIKRLNIPYAYDFDFYKKITDDKICDDMIYD